LNQELKFTNENLSTNKEAYNFNAYRMTQQDQLTHLTNPYNRMMYSNNQAPNMNFNQNIFSGVNIFPGNINYPNINNFLFNNNPVYQNCNSIPIIENLNNNSLLLNTIQTIKNISQLQSLNNININNLLYNIVTGQCTNSIGIMNQFMNVYSTPK
jgi:hypothetical protein